LALTLGTPERRTHDYVRHGTTNLYAALDVASGKVIADLTARHRAGEFRRFVTLIDRTVPEVAPPRHPPLHPRAHRRRPGLDRQLEQRPQTLRLAQDRRRHPRQPGPLLPTNLRLRSLVV
jgi:hypothetical protein